MVEAFPSVHKVLGSVPNTKPTKQTKTHIKIFHLSVIIPIEQGHAGWKNGALTPVGLNMCENAVVDFLTPPGEGIQ